MQCRWLRLATDIVTRLRLKNCKPRNEIEGKIRFAWYVQENENERMIEEVKGVTLIGERNLNSEKKKRVQEKQTKLITMCWVSSEHLDGIWISCARWTIEIPIYFELSVDHLVAGSDWSPQRGDSQPYFAALCCQCWNRKQRYR